VFAFQRLHTGHCIRTHRPLALRGAMRRLLGAGADSMHLLIACRVMGWGQPIPPAMGLKRPLLRNRAAWRPES
jgi:hypothetical protein